MGFASRSARVVGLVRLVAFAACMTVGASVAPHGIGSAPACADEGPAADPAKAPPPDALSDALAAAHVHVEDLGVRPRGSWGRYPTDPPYKLPFFDDLLAHPLDTYEAARTLGNAVEDLLTPARLRSAPDADRPESLYALCVTVATDRRVGGMRGFGKERRTNVGSEDLNVGLEWLLRESGLDPVEIGKRLGLNPGGKYARSWGPEEGPLARLLRVVVDARTEIDRGLRRTTLADRTWAWSRLPTLVAALPDAGEDVTAFDDLVGRVDAMPLAHGALLAIDGLQRARRELEAARPKEGWPDIELRDSSPWGDVVIVARRDRTPIVLPPGPAPLLLVALTPVRSASAAGSTSSERTLSLALFLDGVESLGAAADAADAPIGGVASGVLGCGVVYVAGDGATRYECTSHGLGCGVLGTGVLVDEGGDDVYRMRSCGMGAALFGAGLLLDAAGDDRYALLGGEGQGYGGPGGIGVLADRSGNDAYVAEPLPSRAGADRADYHSDGKIVSSAAQGVGFGRRGDLNDGRAWAGGLGALLDVDGDDTYAAGNFSQGVGYWFGTGLLYDGGGDDRYDSVYFSHGSGAHFAIGAVVDEGGDDVHRLSDFPNAGLGPKAGAGIAFGWDVVNAFVFERAGNDRYEADILSCATSNVRSLALLLDEGGDDVYVAREGSAAFGAVDELPTYGAPHRTSPFAFHLPQHAILLDLGGADRYLRVPAGGGEAVPDARAGDDRTWSREAPTGPGAGRDVAIARDVARGRAGFLDAWPRRVAPPRAPRAEQPAPPPAPAPPPTPEPASTPGTTGR